MTKRKKELAANLRDVHERVAAACSAAGRDPSEVTVIGVTKTHPVADVRLLAGLGVRDLGENRAGELAEKVTECPDLDVRWHFIGQVQTNKAKIVARFADIVHSVDRRSLISALGAGAVAAGRELDVLLQVSLDGDPSRGGAERSDIPGLAELVTTTAGIRLRGVMAVAPLVKEPRKVFAQLPSVLDEVRAVEPKAWVISAGMSGDLEAAVSCGATHLRVGTAVLGLRHKLR